MNLCLRLVLAAAAFVGSALVQQAFGQSTDSPSSLHDAPGIVYSGGKMSISAPTIELSTMESMSSFAELVTNQALSDALSDLQDSSQLEAKISDAKQQIMASVNGLISDAKNEMDTSINQLKSALGPAAPTDLQAFNEFGNQVTLTWTNPLWPSGLPVEKWRIYKRKTGNDGPAELVGEVSPDKDFIFIDEGLDGGTEYELSVVGANGDIEGTAASVTELVDEAFKITPPSGSDVVKAEVGMKVWSDEVYNFLEFPGVFEASDYVRGKRRTGDTGQTVSVNGPFSATMCCANHCGSGNTIHDDPGKWDTLPGTYELSNHGGEPCTFYTRTFPAGDHFFDCLNCWGTGIFIQSLGAIADLTISDEPETLVKSFSGMPLWQDNHGNYRVVDASVPDGLMGNPYIRSTRGAADRAIQVRFQAHITITMCCANHYNGGGVPMTNGAVDSDFKRLPGNFPIQNHGGTPCTWYSKTLEPGTYAFRCTNVWASGIFLQPYE